MPIISRNTLNLIKLFIKENPETKPYSLDLEKRFNYRYKVIQNEFRRVFGLSIQEYHCNVKCCRMLKMIIKEDSKRKNTVYAYAIDLGFSSDSGLQNFTKRRFDMTFNEARKDPIKVQKMICECTCKFIHEF